MTFKLDNMREKKSSSETHSISWKDEKVPEAGDIQDQIRQTSIRNDMGVDDPLWSSGEWVT